MSILINLSNHPSSKWSEEQLEAVIGKVIDLPFPTIDPEFTKRDIYNLAIEYIGKCDVIMDKEGIKDISNATVLVQGEMTFVHAFVKEAEDIYLTCVAATSKRESVELPDGKKVVTFKFVKFRPY